MEGTSLYQLTETYKQIQAMVEEDGDEAAFEDTLDSINWNEDFENKCDGYAMVIRNVELSIAADKGQIEYLDKLLKAVKDSKTAKENKIKRMKESMYEAMNKVGKTKFKSQRFSYWTQKNTPSLVIDNPENVPLEYFKTPAPEIDKEAIKKALKDGETFSFAHLETTEGVRFK